MGTDDEILAELRQIRELLTKPPAPPSPKGLTQESKAFLTQYGVLGLAVAFIIGAYLGALVKSLVSDLILMVGPFGVGEFANALLTFIIVACVIFLVVKLAGKYKIG